MTQYEKHIIISNGFYWKNGSKLAHHFTESTNIYVLTLPTNETNYKLNKSKYKIPNYRIHSTSIIIGGEKEHELCVVGWCRIYFNIDKIPLVIPQIILSFYNQQELHSIDSYGKHYSIPIKMILSSCYCYD